MANKKDESIEAQSIKEYERALRAKVESPLEEKIEFESWWAKRASLLNQPNHIKEILKADAQARGLKKEDTVERWDWAARQFGLTI